MLFGPSAAGQGPRLGQHTHTHKVAVSGRRSSIYVDRVRNIDRRNVDIQLTHTHTHTSSPRLANHPCLLIPPHRHHPQPLQCLKPTPHHHRYHPDNNYKNHHKNSAKGSCSTLGSWTIKE